MVLVLAGCTTVSISDKDGSTRIERHFGVVSIELAPRTSAVEVEVSSVGYLGGPMGITVGLTHSRITAMSRECRLIVWLAGEEPLAKLNKIFAGRRGLCALSSEQTTTEK